MQEDKHIFAIFSKDLSLQLKNLSEGESLSFKDKALANRIKSVLRLAVGDKVILFDEDINAVLSILSQENKNAVSAKILSIHKNQYLEPKVILSFGLVKREYLEGIAYFASAMGANEFQPIMTSKVQAKWVGEKELLRLRKIMIAAAEQSKSFSLPKINNPISFDDFVGQMSDQYSSATKITFDAEGKPLFEILSDLNQSKPDSVVLNFGPEGGLSKLEIDRLIKIGFQETKLTPTILRTVESVAVGLGAIRSCL